LYPDTTEIFSLTTYEGISLDLEDATTFFYFFIFIAFFFHS